MFYKAYDVFVEKHGWANTFSRSCRFRSLTILEELNFEATKNPKLLSVVACKALKTSRGNVWNVVANEAQLMKLEAT